MSMERIECSMVAPGVTRLELGWGYGLRGKKEALLQTGLVQPQWFPNGEKDTRGRTIRTRKMRHEDKQTMCRDLGGERFYIAVTYTDRELEIRDQRNAAQSEKDETQYRSREEYRDKALAHTDKTQEFLLYLLNIPQRGPRRFGLAPETLSALHDAFARVRAVLEEGHITEISDRGLPEGVIDLARAREQRQLRP